MSTMKQEAKNKHKEEQQVIDVSPSSYASAISHSY